MTDNGKQAKPKAADPRQELFPRATELPKQSPLFWVEQKDRYLRQLLIRDIEELTGRSLAVYYANRFENAQIDPKDPAYVTELLGDVVGTPVDLLLETSGGYTDAAEAVVSILQNLVPDLRVIVANAAKSNGIVLCLAAQSIVMGCTSELGPIEPQINGIPSTVLIEPQIQQQNFVLHKAGAFALSQTQKLAKKLLVDGMMKGRPDAEIAAVVQQLSSRDTYASHGSVIDHREAKAMGLVVDYLPPDDPIWERIWLLYCMYEHDCRKAGYLKVFEGHSRSTALSVPPAPAPQP